MVYCLVYQSPIVWIVIFVRDIIGIQAKNDQFVVVISLIYYVNSLSQCIEVCYNRSSHSRYTYNNILIQSTKMPRHPSMPVLALLPVLFLCCFVVALLWCCGGIVVLLLWWYCYVVVMVVLLCFFLVVLLCCFVVVLLCYCCVVVVVLLLSLLLMLCCFVVVLLCVVGTVQSRRHVIRVEYGGGRGLF